MGKSEDLARQRAEQHARLERDAKRREDEAKRKPPPAPPVVATPPIEVVATPPKAEEIDVPIALVPVPIALVSVPIDVAALPPVNEQRDVEKKSKAKKASAASAKATAATKPKGNAEATASNDETGRCSSCGKVKALNRGLVADHQKGLGKSCPGSRKPPA